MLRILCLLLLSAIPAFGQSSTPTVTVATLNDLLARAPRANESALVLRGYNGQDWGDGRVFTQTTSSALTTNVAHVFAITNIYGAQGQWLSADRTNSVQDIRWWRGGPQAVDNTAPLTNAAAYVYNLGGGYVKADSGTHNFLSTGINMPSGVRLIGAGADATVFNFTAATPAYDYEHCIRWIGELSSGVGIITNTTAGGRSLILDAPVDWAAGSMLQIRQTNYFSFGGRRDYSAGEFNYINTVDGGTNIFLGERLEDGYPTGYTRVAMWTPSVGSVEGIHFALGPTIGPVMMDYCDARSYMRDCSASGSDAEHFSIRRSYGITVDGLFVDWDSDPVAGQNYGLVVGDSENIVVRNSFFRTSRAGFDAGGSTIPTRYLTVTGTTMGSTRTSSHGAGLHEDVVESAFENCVFLSGVSLGGGRNRLLNSIVQNNTDRAAVAVPAGRYFDWEVRGNQIEAAVDPTLGIVYGLRMYLHAGSQGAHPESTNYWPGTFGGTENQSIRIMDNQFRMVGVVTNTQYPLLIDEATTLTANTNITAAMFGRLEISRNQFFYDPAQPTNEVTSGGVIIQLGSKIRWPEVIVADNLFAAGPPQINLNGGKLVFRHNTVQQSLRKEGVYIYPTDVTQNWAPIDVVIDGNTWLSPFGSAFFVANTGGRLVARNNRVFDHGRSADSTYKFAFKITETTTNALTDIEFVDNLFASTNSPSYDVAVYSAVAPLWESGTQLGGSTTLGSRSAAGGYLRWPRIMNAAGATNGIALLGQYTALPTASSYPPGLAHSAGDLWYSDGVSWTNFMRSSTTNFHNLRSTNGLVGKDLIAETATLGNDWPGDKQAVAGTLPLFIIRNTNAYVRSQIYNVNTGSSGAALWDAVAYGAQGNFGAFSTNNSSGNALARTFMNAQSGKGLAFDLLYPNSMDMVYTYGGGVEFARLSTNIFSLPAVATLAPTSTVSHVAIFDTDPSASTRRQIKSMTLADLKNAMGTSSSTNLDNLTVTNTVRFGGNFTISDTIGGTDRFTLTGSGIKSFLQFTSFGDLLVGNAAGVYASSTNNWFYNGINQYWPGTVDFVWLTSVGFKNATPLRGANILDSTTIDWTTSGTNVTPSIKSQSLSTNLIDSTFYSLLMMTNTGGSGSTTTNRLVKSLYQNGSSLTIAATELSEKSVMTNAPNWAVTNFAAGYWTTDKALHVEASGTFTAAADWSGNVIRVKLGSYVLSYTFDEPDSTTPTDAAWRIVADIQVSATGTNATVAGVGSLIYYQGTAATMLQSGVIAAVPSGTLDTTVQNTLSVTYDNDGTQPLTFKVHSLFAEEKGAEILTSGGSGSSSPASLVSVNGTTNNWNFNSSTPATPTETVNAQFLTSGTNASVNLAVAPTLGTAQNYIVISNRTDFVPIQSGTITPTNLPYIGSSLFGQAFGTFYNASGASRTYTLMFVIGGVTNFTDTTASIVTNSVGVVRAISNSIQLTRGTNDMIQASMLHTLSGVSSPTIGSAGSLASTPTITTRPLVPLEFDWDGSSNLTWSVQIALSAASADYSMSWRNGGAK